MVRSKKTTMTVEHLLQGLPLLRHATVAVNRYDSNDACATRCAKIGG